jgi:hypothetical protein
MISVLRCDSGVRSRVSSRLRIRPTNSAEPAKLTASTAIATGAVSAWINKPAMVGPVI